MSLDVNEQCVIAGDSGGGLSLLEVIELHPGAKLQFRSALGSNHPPSVVLCSKLVSLRGSVYAVSGTASGYLRVHTVLTGSCVATVKLHQLGLNCIAVHHSMDGEVLIVTGGDDQAIVLSSFIPDGKVTTVSMVPLAHYSAVKGLTVSDTSLVSVSWDGQLSQWTLPTLHRTVTHSHFVGDCATVVALPPSVIVCGMGLEQFRVSRDVSAGTGPVQLQGFPGRGGVNQVVVQTQRGRVLEQGGADAEGVQGAIRKTVAETGKVAGVKDY